MLSFYRYFPSIIIRVTVSDDKKPTDQLSVNSFTLHQNKEGKISAIASVTTHVKVAGQ